MPMSSKDLKGWLTFARDVGDRGEDDAVGAILALDTENRKLREALRGIAATGLSPEATAALADCADEERAS